MLALKTLFQNTGRRRIFFSRCHI